MAEAPVDEAVPPASVAHDGPDATDPAAADYWAGVLATLPRELSLPADRVRAPGQSWERTSLTVALPVMADRGLLVAAWVAVVSRLSGQYEWALGLPVPGADGLVPVAVACEAVSTFAEVERSVADAHLGAIRHAPAPAAAADAPAFRVAVSERRAADAADGADLVLVLDGTESSIEHTGVFDSASVADLAEQWQRAVAVGVDDASRTIDDVDLTSDDARALVRRWGTGPVDAVPPWTVPAEFARRRDEGPARAAVRSGSVTSSYDDLAARAFRIAHVLRGLGAGRGTRVAVCLDRTTDMVASLVGVLATGAAYVPVDPAYPAERVDYMLTDAEVIAVVTTSDLAVNLPVTAATVVTLDTPRWADALAAAPADPPAEGPTHEDTAYVIYTSGSTGKPKGVMVPHGALTNFLESVSREPGMRAGDVLLAVTTLSFDIAGLELYLPLVVGGTIVLAAQDETRDPASLIRLLTEHDVDVMQATPATWRMLVDGGWEGKADLLVLCGGEALPPSLADALIPRCGQLWNMYGPTETTIWSSLCHLAVPGELPTLGHAFLNTTLHVVDERMREVPIGVAGELLIGGAGLAQGYRGRDDLTTEKFLPSPFAGFPEAGARVYRTGDLVRWRRDGRLEFLGRIDNQVKVRGFRIELGEIETILDAHEEVAEAVVLVREDDGSDKQLVGYVVRQPGSAISAGDLRRHVGGSLPAYMVPAAVVILDAFPRTPNGKTDRKALPAPDASAMVRDDVVAARDDLEARLVAVWEEVLRISPIGVTDNFFDLGVDSLTAARLFARVERDFGTKLPLAPVFRAPTISALADLLRGEAAEEAQRWSSMVPMQPKGSAPPIFGVHGGAGTILLYAELVRQLGEDQPFYGFQSAGLYGGDAPDLTVGDMADRYIAEMRQVQPHGPYTLLGYCFGALVAEEMALRLVDQGEAINFVGTLNGPSISYIDEFGGEIPPDREPAPTKTDKLRAAASRGPLAVAYFLARSAYRRLRRPVQRRWRRWRFQRVLAARKPLPDWMRENMYFQRISMAAQDKYRPRRGSFPVAVFHAPTLYHHDDLGWAQHTDGPVWAYSVPGDGQDVPRSTMRDPYARYIADRLRELLHSIAQTE